MITGRREQKSCARGEQEEEEEGHTHTTPSAYAAAEDRDFLGLLCQESCGCYTFSLFPFFFFGVFLVTYAVPYANTQYYMRYFNMSLYLLDYTIEYKYTSCYWSLITHI